MSVSGKFGVLFDWDGVVVDSSSHHFLSWQRLAEEIGKSISEDQFRESFGQVNRAIIPGVLGWATDPDEVERLGARKEELYRQIVREKGLDPLAGARELVISLKDAGVPRVVGTSSEKENILTALEVMGMSGLFDGIVASEDVQRGKPDPEVFLKAAELAGLAPERCVVLEDSHHGLQAAESGGMKSVGVLTTHGKEKLGQPDLFVADLSELTVEKLQALFSD
ncbi:MAG: HAD family hydrolase [Puniceicoccales bacterium]